MKLIIFKPAYILSIFCSFFCFSKAFAQKQNIEYLSYKDTLFVSVDAQTGDKICNYTIKQGQTLYSLARFFGMNEEELYSYNPKLSSNKLTVGQVVRVPIANKAIRRTMGTDFKRWKFAPVYFIVQKGDNLYNIARRLYHVAEDSVAKWNNLKTHTLTVGQRLHVGWMSINGVPDSLRSTKNSMESNARKAELNFEKQKKISEQRGSAFWIKKGNPKTDFYCLHRTAKKGSYVAITNGQTGRTVHAKVLGSIPDKAYPSEIVLLVSPSVARYLGAVDEKFFVKIKYEM